MSKIYEKSISDKFSNYFEKPFLIKKNFASYDLRSHTISIPTETFPWDSSGGGVPLYYDDSSKKVYLDHTDSHSLIIGPTGSKKTRLIALPTIKNLSVAKESMIISDPKAELYSRTYMDLEKKGYKIFVINLRSPERSNCWNPLYVPYKFYLENDIDHACEFANDIAENFMSENIKNDPFWANSASAFLFGLILLLFKYCKDFNLSLDNVNLQNLFSLRDKLVFSNNKISSNLFWEYAKKDSIIFSAMVGTMETVRETSSGILSTLNEKLRSFSIQPNLLNMLSSNDIDFDIIGQKPTAVFLILPDEKTSYHRLVSLFVKQSYEYLVYCAQQHNGEDGLVSGKVPLRINYILDEFSSLPTIKDFPAMITAARSRNIRFSLFIQSKHQLLQKYNEETQTIQANCSNWLFLSSREIDLLQEISSLCGNVYGQHVKPLISVPELQQLDKKYGETLILCKNNKPYITKLPDISEYDNDSYLIGSFPIQEHKKIDTTIFYEELNKNVMSLFSA